VVAVKVVVEVVVVVEEDLVVVDVVEMVAGMEVEEETIEEEMVAGILVMILIREVKDHPCVMIHLIILLVDQ